jgi:hypothetical protein
MSILHIVRDKGKVWRKAELFCFVTENYRCVCQKQLTYFSKLRIRWGGGGGTDKKVLILFMLYTPWSFVFVIGIVKMHHFRTCAFLKKFIKIFYDMFSRHFVANTH